MSDPQIVDEVWVNTFEGAEATGYNRRYVQQLASKFWNMPEEERPVKVRYRSQRYEMWLPDLIFYLNNIGYGPLPKKTSKE